MNSDVSTGLSSVAAGTSSSGSLGVGGFPTFPKWLLPRHYRGLKLKTGRKEGGRFVEPPDAAPLFRRFSATPGSPGFTPLPAPLPGASSPDISLPPTPQATYTLLYSAPEKSAEAGRPGRGRSRSTRVCGLPEPHAPTASPAGTRVAGSGAWPRKGAEGSPGHSVPSRPSSLTVPGGPSLCPQSVLSLPERSCSRLRPGGYFRRPQYITISVIKAPLCLVCQSVSRTENETASGARGALR